MLSFIGIVRTCPNCTHNKNPAEPKYQPQKRIFTKIRNHPHRYRHSESCTTEPKRGTLNPTFDRPSTKEEYEDYQD